jgi:serine/threonine protein phosphatase PrpC
MLKIFACSMLVCIVSHACSMLNYEIDFGVAAIQADKHNRMEDFYSIKNCNWPGHFPYFAVFDGHSGEKWGKHIAGTLANGLYEKIRTQIIQNWSEGTLRQQRTVPEQFTCLFRLAILLRYILIKYTPCARLLLGTVTEEQVRKAVHDAFLSYNRSLNAEVYRNMGSTACVSIFVDNVLYVANVGDSRAVLCDPIRDELAMTVDHTANNPQEIARINQGGTQNIRNGRLYGGYHGDLAVTRGFGDFEFAHYGLIAEPHIASLKVESDISLVMCSDGIWDLYTNHAVAELVHRRIRAKSSLQDIAQCLILSAASESQKQMTNMKTEKERRKKIMLENHNFPSFEPLKLIPVNTFPAAFPSKCRFPASPQPVHDDMTALVVRVSANPTNLVKRAGNHVVGVLHWVKSGLW